MRTPALLATSIFLAFGCSSESMHDDSGELATALAGQSAETARHRQACEKSASMPGMLDELGRHVQTMDGLMARMDRGMGEMSSCSSSETERLSTGLSGVRAQEGAHRSRLEAASDLQSAHHECVRYAPMMEETLAWMMNDLDRMSCMMMGR